MKIAYSIIANCRSPKAVWIPLLCPEQKLQRLALFWILPRGCFIVDHIASGLTGELLYKLQISLASGLSLAILAGE
jgi:hypothetical protein